MPTRRSSSRPRPRDEPDDYLIPLTITFYEDGSVTPQRMLKALELSWRVAPYRTPDLEPLRDLTVKSAVRV
jgi:hypothetical protein